MFKRSHHGIYETKQASADLKEFAALMRSRRIAAGLSQAALIEKVGAGFSVAQLSNIERAKNWPSGPVIYRLCRVLGMRIPSVAKKNKNTA